MKAKSGFSVIQIIDNPDLANHIPAAEPPIFGVSRFAMATTSLMLLNMASLYQDVSRKPNSVKINLRFGN
jgi:hypothetical protein